MKTLKNHLLIATGLLLFVLHSIGLALPTPGASSSAPDAASNLQDPLSDAIIGMANVYFTPEKIAAAKNAGLLTERTHTFLETAKTALEKAITDADNNFLQTPGYQELKEKLLASIEQFSIILGYTGPHKVIAPASPTKLIGALEKFLKILEANKCMYNLLPRTAYPLAILSTETAEPLAKNLSKECRKDLYNLVSIKLAYLNTLRELDETGETLLISSYERPEWHLTLSDAYQTHLLLQKKAQAKNSQPNKHLVDQQEQYLQRAKDVYRSCHKRLLELDPNAANKFETLPSQAKPLQSADHYYGIAVNIRGALYEIEAALQAQKHGKKIVAFGPEVQLLFNAGTRQELIEEIRRQPFLHPVTIKHNNQLFCSIKQEFDLATENALIECKCTESNIAAYLDNLKREQFVSQHITDADAAIVTSKTCSGVVPIKTLADKPIVCYVKYAEDFLHKEKKLRKTDASYADTESLLARIHEESRYKEPVIAHEGFSLWNGSTYSQTLVIPNPYEQMPTIEDFIKLKREILAIGNDHFTLHIIAQKKHHNYIRNRLKDLITIYQAHAMNPSTGRRNSLPGHQSPLLFFTTETAPATTEKSRSSSPELGPLNEMRVPLPLLGIIFSEETTDGQQSPIDSSEEESETGFESIAASPLRTDRVKKRLQVQDPLPLQDVFKSPSRADMAVSSAQTQQLRKARKQLNFEKNSGR